MLEIKCNLVIVLLKTGLNRIKYENEEAVRS